jgi:ATP-dependent DNA helicase RecG
MRDRNSDERLLESLVGEDECEWVEFKKSSFDPERVGRYVSALGNGARLCDKPHGFLAWGVSNSGEMSGPRA